MADDSGARRLGLRKSNNNHGIGLQAHHQSRKGLSVVYYCVTEAAARMGVIRVVAPEAVNVKVAAE